jgi:isopropylmalate/homocitrate/citramalate synthase
LNDEQLIFDAQERWWVARLNRSPLVAHSFPESVRLVDCSLREGEEYPNVRMTLETKLEIVEASAALGFDEMEVGYPGAIDEHYAEVQAMRDRGISARLASHTRIYTPDDEWKEEISRAVECGSDVLTFVGWASDALCEATPWLPPDAVAERIGRCVEYAKGLGAEVSVGLADCVRTPLERIDACYAAAAKAGADRVYVYDGMGAATPHSIAFLVRWVKQSTGCLPIALHCHNDYGLSMANVLAGVGAGATVIDTVPGGLGDQTGISPLEQVAFALELLYDVRTGINLEGVPGFCRQVIDAAGAQLAAHAPLLGENVGRHQLDSHIATVLRGSWYSWENIDPAFLGTTRRLEFASGKVRRGRAGAVRAILDRGGLTATDGQIGEMQSRLRETISSRGTVDERALASIVREVLDA